MAIILTQMCLDGVNEEFQGGKKIVNSEVAPHTTKNQGAAPGYCYLEKVSRGV